MKQIFINKGKVLTEEVPVKSIEKGFVKIKTVYSCISMGTELAGITSSGKTLIQRIKENPDYIKRGIQMLKEKGMEGTKGVLHNSFDGWNPLGYSASGIVIETSEDVKGIFPGDRVACAGGNYATHSEYLVVPKNLVVKIPEEVNLKDASSVAIGSIAMQGIRRANVKLGELVCVIGMGLIGQLTVQLLKAAGTHVIAVDVNEKRVQQAKQLGADYVLNSSDMDVIDIINNLTDGMGVDSSIITASTDSSEPLHQAFSVCRKRGRIVLVGVVDIDIDRSDMYEKELEFLISTSYGPGRYDENYEEKGIDYPYHWVRFTENRNMKEYIHLIAEKKIVLDSLFGDDAKITEAEKVYNSLLNDANRPFMVAFKYSEEEKTIEQNSVFVTNKVQKTDKINVAVCGIGGFAKNFHLPNLRKLQNFYNIYAIMSRNGGNAKKAAEEYNAQIATTSYESIINDDTIDVIIICTRHNLHYQYIVEALKKGKTVFVEKPLCLTSEQLSNIKKATTESKGGIMVGYNRRYSPHAQEVQSYLKSRINPMIINYTMNAGYISPESWVHTDEGGGRIIGEACHIFDLFSYFIDERPISVFVNAITPVTTNVSNRDNVTISIKYKDGSVANLIYCANGNSKYPKEMCEIFCDNNTYIINDYKETIIFGKKQKKITTKIADKGHLKELEEFAKAYKNGIKYLIPFEELEATSNLSFTINELL